MEVASSPATATSPVVKDAPFALQTADFVLVYDLGAAEKKSNSKSKVPDEIQRDLDNTLATGLDVAAFRLSPTQLAVAVHCPPGVLRRELQRADVADLLNGTTANFTRRMLDGRLDETLRNYTTASAEVTPARRAWLVHSLLVAPTYQGGAGIDDRAEQRRTVSALFALKDKAFNTKWMSAWARSVFLSRDDLSEIRDHFGEKIAFYFAFTQFYFRFLSVPSVVGTLFWVYELPQTLFGLFIILWATLFVEMWRVESDLLARRWGVRGVGEAEPFSIDFVADEFLHDPATGRKSLPHYPPWKRLRTILLIRMPVVLVSICVVVSIVAFLFVWETFMVTYYKGPLKDILVYSPTVGYVASIPLLTSLYNKIAHWLTRLENHPTTTAAESSFTAKTFMFNFVLNFVPFFMILFVLVPFSNRVDDLQGAFFGKYFPTGSGGGITFTIAKDLKTYLIYFLITAQIISLVQEVLVPMLTRKIEKKIAIVKNSADKEQEDEEKTADPEKEFVYQVRKQLSLPAYDVHEDYLEMISQFGYVVLFSIIWPVASLPAFVNNWLELRSDAAKICLNHRQPPPIRVESIQPWFAFLRFLLWISLVTNGTIIDLSRHGVDFDLRSIVVQILVFEHAYFAFRTCVRYILRGVGRIDKDELVLDGEVKRIMLENLQREIREQKADVDAVREKLARQHRLAEVVAFVKGEFFGGKSD